MDLQLYGQSFSQGQITIPKAFRDNLGLGHKFSYKMTLKDHSLILEPVVKPTLSMEDYRKKLLSIKGGWIDEKEIKRNRRQMEKRFKSLKW